MQNHYYAVEAKCGHVGRGKCIWIVFAVVAENGKEAAKEARNKRRVKHDHKDAIRSVKKISFEEFITLKDQNSRDPYLHCKNIQEQRKFENFEERVVLDEYLLRQPVKKAKNKEYHQQKQNILRKESYSAIMDYLQWEVSV